MEKKTIAVVIPAYKVEDHIEKVINGIPDIIDIIIVVNDCSPDHTTDRVRALNNPRIRIIEHKKNWGVGKAMLSGYAAAIEMGADIIIKMDGDDQMDPQYLPALIEPIDSGKADYTKGNRFLHFTQLQKMPTLRRIGNLGLTFLTKLASGYWNIYDPTNGYTAIRAKMLQQVNPYEISNNYFFETSMLCELRIAGAVVMDIAIPARYQGEKSSMNIGKQLFTFSINLLGHFSKRVYRLYFLYDFTAVSLYIIMGTILGVFGTIWGLINWAKSAETLITASTGTVLLAVLPIILGVQFLIQAVALDIADTPKQVNLLQPMEESIARWKAFR